ncbi:MAG: thioester domain-containing protein [Clostridium sp.]
MKTSDKFKLLTLTLLLIFTFCTNSFIVNASTVPDKLNITTSDYILGRVYYDNFSMIAKKITSPLGIGYCLEIDKPYPHGEKFANIGDVHTAVKNILSCGYPVKSPSLLNLESEDDAYFATQIAIWSSIEGYDVNEISGDRPEILEAIKLIYNNSLNSPDTLSDFNVNIYFTGNNIQNVLILSSPTIQPVPPAPPAPPVPPTPEIPPTPESPPVVDDEPIYNGK